MQVAEPEKPLPETSETAEALHLVDPASCVSDRKLLSHFELTQPM